MVPKQRRDGWWRSRFLGLRVTKWRCFNKFSAHPGLCKSVERQIWIALPTNPSGFHCPALQGGIKEVEFQHSSPNSSQKITSFWLPSFTSSIGPWNRSPNPPNQHQRVNSWWEPQEELEEVGRKRSAPCGALWRKFPWPTRIPALQKFGSKPGSLIFQPTHPTEILCIPTCPGPFLKREFSFKSLFSQGKKKN